MSRFLLRRFSISSLLKLKSSSSSSTPAHEFNQSNKSSFQFPLFPTTTPTPTISPNNPFSFSRNFSHVSVNLVLSEGKPKFETREFDSPTKGKWVTKKKLKLQRKKEKLMRNLANKKDPRNLGVKGKKKRRFLNPEERITGKLRKAKIKEAMLIERLKRYDVPKQQGPVVEPANLTGEERFYMKKMAQKRSNYAPVGRRGIFGGVILNMHMHWKKHETVKVICKPCKPGQVQDYAEEIARLSGGTPIHIVGDDTIIFYRGKNYVQPEVMSPIDTLSKKRALEKSKYEQSLASVRQFMAVAEKELELYYRHIAIYGLNCPTVPQALEKSKYEQSLASVRQFMAVAEKELELYYRHIAIYGDPNDRNPLSIFDRPNHELKEPVQFDTLDNKNCEPTRIHFPSVFTEAEDGCTDKNLSGTEDELGEKKTG